MITSYNCPNCSAPVDPGPSGKTTCEYCNSILHVTGEAIITQLRNNYPVTDELITSRNELHPNDRTLTITVINADSTRPNLKLYEEYFNRKKKDSSIPKIS